MIESVKTREFREGEAVASAWVSTIRQEAKNELSPNDLVVLSELIGLKFKKYRIEVQKDMTSCD
jgi:hypothetical protein